MSGIRKRKIYVFLGILFLFFIVVFGICEIVKKDNAYSNAEERVLAEKPVFSTEKLLDGTIVSETEEYLKDQFPLRPFWSGIRTSFLRLLGHKESANVFIGSNGYLLEENQFQAGDSYQKNIQAIKKFCKENQDITSYMLIVPNAAEILKNKLPSGAMDSSQRVWINKLQKMMDKDLNWISVSDTLREHSAENLYYRTDNKWTTLGAYYAFQTAMGDLQIKSEHMVEYKKYAITENFTGNLAARSGFKRSKKEKIYMYVPKNDDTKYIAEYKDDDFKSASLYSSKALETKKKYDVFLNGRQSQVTIRTTASDKRRILIFKNDYANCFIPFLTPYYREIVVIDPDLWTGDLTELVEEEKITDVLFLYDMNGFMQDKSIYQIFEKASIAVPKVEETEEIPDLTQNQQGLSEEQLENEQ